MPITNQIFEHFRANEREISKAIKLLEKNGYIVYNKKKQHETNF